MRQLCIVSAFVSKLITPSIFDDACMCMYVCVREGGRERGREGEGGWGGRERGSSSKVRG